MKRKYFESLKPLEIAVNPISRKQLDLVLNLFNPK